MLIIIRKLLLWQRISVPSTVHPPLLSSRTRVWIRLVAGLLHRSRDVELALVIVSIKSGELAAPSRSTLDMDVQNQRNQGRQQTE